MTPPRLCSGCSAPLRFRLSLGAFLYPYWCDNCDRHAVGCLKKRERHLFGKCEYANWR